jgi:hypothetical protein
MLAVAVNKDACWGGANAVSAARRCGGWTKPCADHPATWVFRPVAVVVPSAAPTAAGQLHCPSSSTRLVLVKDNHDNDSSGGLAKYVAGGNDVIIIIVRCVIFGWRK